MLFNTHLIHVADNVTHILQQMHFGYILLYAICSFLASKTAYM